jgi:hypothetical protein
MPELGCAERFGIYAFIRSSLGVPDAYQGSSSVLGDHNCSRRSQRPDPIANCWAGEFAGFIKLGMPCGRALNLAGPVTRESVQDHSFSVAFSHWNAVARISEVERRCGDMG